MLSENYTASASQTVFNFTFDIIETDYLSVSIDDVLAADWSRTADKEITLGPSIVLTGGEIVTIGRTTPVDEPLVEFTAPSSVRAREINIAVLQLLHRIQEQEADFSQSIGKNFLQTKWDAEGLPMEQLGDPTADTEAVTLGYLNADLLDYLTNNGTEWDGQGLRISGLAAPSDGDDAVTVDSQAATLLNYLTFSGSDWQGLGKRLSDIAAPQDDADAVTQGSLNTVLVDYLTNDATSWDGKNLRIGNVAIPVDSNDVATKEYLDQVVIDSGLIPATDVTDAGKFLTVDENGFWVVETVLPVPTPSDDDKILRVDATGAYELSDETVEIPTLGVGDAGKVLRATGEVPGAYAWTDTGELPDSFPADEDKVLTVDASGDPQWEAVTPELPAVTGADEDKVLTVDASGDWVAATAAGGGGGPRINKGSNNTAGVSFSSVGTIYPNWGTVVDGRGATLTSNTMTWTINEDNQMVTLNLCMGVYAANLGSGPKKATIRILKNGTEITRFRSAFMLNADDGTGSSFPQNFQVTWTDDEKSVNGDTYQMRIAASGITADVNDNGWYECILHPAGW